ncbi:hypothetical protein C1H46_008427 [Malus baccata]|uniref:Cytochrome P450 n=1 Tax=Malus baccata TaxID=106549 RepID=A0A540N623_MALBA|nr:hypothetical protein C1H46_008427 [Malus baccata]
MIRSHARRVGTDLKKKRYHPIATNFFRTLVNFSRRHHYLTDIAHKYKTFRAYNVLIDYVFTTDPANVEYILKTNFANYGRGWYHYSVLLDGLGDGIFAVDGEKWLHQRKISSNVLSTKIVKDFSTTVFKTNVVQIAGIISEAATCDKAIEIQARRDTMVSSLTWFIYMLYKHPHIEEKIVQEVREATNLKDSSSIYEVAASLTDDALDKMHYLHASLSETLRLHPAIPLAGPRNCIGKDFAYRQAKIVCAMLLRSYIFKLSDENKVAHYRTKITLHIDGGLYVQAFPRNLN